MPYAPIWRRRAIGGRVARPMPQSGNGPAVQQHQTINPRAASPARPAAFLTSSKVINTESMTLSASASQGQAYNLPTIGDVLGMSNAISASAATGSGSVTVEWANAIDHIVIRNRNGTPFDTIFYSDPGLAGLGNARIYDWYTLFRPNTPTSVASNTTAAATALTSITKVINALGLRCSAEDGPWQVEHWYSSPTEFAGTGVTGATISNQIKAIFGSSDDGTGQKWNTKFAQQSVPVGTSFTGDFHLEGTGIVKNTLIQHLLLQGMGGKADPDIADVDHFVVNSQGMNIDTNLSEAMVVEAMTANYYNAFNNDTLVPTAGSPAINNGFTVGDGDEFIINFGTAPDYTPFASYYYLLPAGDAY